MKNWFTFAEDIVKNKSGKPLYLRHGVLLVILKRISGDRWW